MDIKLICAKTCDTKMLDASQRAKHTHTLKLNEKILMNMNDGLRVFPENKLALSAVR